MMTDKTSKMHSATICQTLSGLKAALAHVRSFVRAHALNALAPLKLVAAQRIDVPAAEKRGGPVIPRRVAATPSEEQLQSAGSFAEFAKS
jgi:hypothetical protein